ncbi:MAG TPA: hypothetical protein VK993_14145 [Chthoniobacterales bacterium]|nr:hypothetical protein [Chthoniobacterales bacterium]
MRLKALHRATLAVVFFALLAACGGVESRIVGKWKPVSDPNADVWEFSANKTVNMAGRTGKYSFGDQGRLKVQTRSATFVYQLELSQERMVLTEPNGTRTELERVK